MNRIFMMATALTAAIIVAASASITTSSVALAQEDYKTPQAAVDALVATARSGDEKAALVVLGRDGEDIISSGDKVSDDAVRERFVNSYDAKHQITMDGDNKAILVIGDNDYPFPIPLLPVWSISTTVSRCCAVMSS